MRKTTDTTNTTQQPATKRSKPAAPAGESAAHRPTDWLQLSFDWNVPTAQELWQQRRK